jgi:hypothetical protein
LLVPIALGRREIEPALHIPGGCNGQDERAGPFRLDAFATDVVDVVRRAGGWLYDHAARGWRVTVVVADTADPRPLRILGVDVLDLKSAFASAQRPRAHLLAAATKQLESNSQVRQHLLNGTSDNQGRVAVWGCEQSRRRNVVGRFHYRLSSAAYAFKKQALLAAAVDHPPPGVIEEFWWAGKPFERSKRRDHGDNERD